MGGFGIIVCLVVWFCECCATVEHNTGPSVHLLLIGMDIALACTHELANCPWTRVACVTTGLHVHRRVKGAPAQVSLARSIRNDQQQQWERNNSQWYCGATLHPWTALAHWWDIVQQPTSSGA